MVSLLAIVCFATDKSLIPRDVSMLLCVEHEWHKRLIRRMVILAIAYEMNTIIGNLLKNAIEEVRDKDPDLRYIRLILMHRSRHTVVRVSNPCDKREEELSPIFSLGYTTKKAHEGIGLVAVKKICSKYGGTVYIEVGEGVLHVIAKIPCASRV